MSRKMLIDATHEEETRVAIVDGHRLVEFDYESKYRKPLKGSIFLAKVTRVEPSLQAAFVNYGGNRHAFLPFSEIHPDYFRIPIADREALLAEQEAMLQQEEEEENAAAEKEARGESAEENVPHIDGEGNVESVEDHYEDTIEEVGGGEASSPSKNDESFQETEEQPAFSEENADAESTSIEQSIHSEFDVIDENGDEFIGNLKEPEEFSDIDDSIGNNEESNRSANDLAEGNGQNDQNRNRPRRGRGGRGRNNNRRSGGGGRGRPAEQRSNKVEMVGGDDFDDSRKSRFNPRRQYKIQEVVKRGQIMLIQVSKEERGNKGAAVTSYLSLPGRYCVLMPNSPRAGGVSRKIANHQDRARMREMLDEFNIPKGMSVIVRTAGVSRAKEEIKRDLDYLMRLWDNIRDLTLQSTAPAMIYEEADLIKRAVRDLYGRDVDEIQVSGEEGFKTAKQFMKMLMPTHVKNVIEYKDEKIPLFTRHQVESQITEIGESTVTLKSGGYLVINPTEALVSIDVNSGKATKERHIEETAVKTNLEAADEVARQLRLRDLGGLVVVDFIDMEDRRNNAKVERRLKDALSTDRARIQVGRISSFGLLELSRQRLNPSLTEAQYEKCTNCHGQGVIRTSDSTSVLVMRALEEEGMRGRAAQLIAHVSSKVALYILNNKRKHLEEIEKRYGFTVLIRVDDTMGASSFRVEVARPVTGAQDANNAKAVRAPESSENDMGDTDSDSYENDESFDEDESEGEEQQGQPHNHRPSSQSGEPRPDGERPGRRRGRRGGRRRGGRGRSEGRDPNQPQENNAEAGEAIANQAPQQQPRERAPREDRPKREERPQREAANAPAAVPVAAVASNAAPKPVKPPRNEAPATKSSVEYETVSEASGDKKRGWWNRLTE